MEASSYDELIQEAFVKPTSRQYAPRKYYSVNKLVEAFESESPVRIAVFFDKMDKMDKNTKYNNVIIKPLLVIEFFEDKSPVRIEYSKLTEYLEGITDLSVPSWAFRDVVAEEFKTVKLRLINIEAKPTTSKNGNSYHRITYKPVSEQQQSKLSQLQEARQAESML